MANDVPVADDAVRRNPEPLPIVSCGDPTLRRPARPVDLAHLRSGDLAQLIARMRVTMEAAPRGGLAAPPAWQAKRSPPGPACPSRPPAQGRPGAADRPDEGDDGSRSRRRARRTPDRRATPAGGSRRQIGRAS